LCYPIKGGHFLSLQREEENEAGLVLKGDRKLKRVWDVEKRGCGGGLRFLHPLTGKIKNKKYPSREGRKISSTTLSQLRTLEKEFRRKSKLLTGKIALYERKGR